MENKKVRSNYFDTMKMNRPLHLILAGIGCVSLLIYVLACATAFSPDDRQVLYPAFYPQSGALSIALYDRDTGRSEQIFSGQEARTGTNLHSASLRAAWLDAKHILVAEAGGKNSLSLFVLPRGGREPVRQIILPDMPESADALLYPFAMTDTKIFLNGEHSLTRLDWTTGEMLVVTNGILTLPGGDNQTILGFREQHGTNQMTDFGVVDPQTLAFTSRLTLRSDTGNGGDGTFPHFNPATGQIYFIGGEKTNAQLCVRQDGVEKFTRRIARGSDKITVVGPWLDLGPKKDRVFTAYTSQAAGQTNCEYGLLEIPLNEQPLRFTPLFQVPADTDGFLMAQPSLSHDGRTWAVSSAWLGAKKKSALRPEDSALYLVSVDRSRPKITKVPITQPAVDDDGVK